MSIVKKIKKMEPVVKQILSSSLEARESDQMLVLKFWAHQNPELRTREMSFVEFSHEYLKGTYSNADTITRCARKLKENNVELRGKNYKARKDLEDETRRDINNA